MRPSQELLLGLKDEMEGLCPDFVCRRPPFEWGDGRRWTPRSQLAIFLTGPYVTLPSDEQDFINWLKLDTDPQIDYPPPQYFTRCPGCGVNPFSLQLRSEPEEISGGQSGDTCAVGFFSQQYFVCGYKQGGLPFTRNKVIPRIW